MRNSLKKYLFKTTIMSLLLLSACGKDRPNTFCDSHTGGLHYYSYITIQVLDSNNHSIFMDDSIVAHSSSIPISGLSSQGFTYSFPNTMYSAIDDSLYTFLLQIAKADGSIDIDTCYINMQYKAMLDQCGKTIYRGPLQPNTKLLYRDSLYPFTVNPIDETHYSGFIIQKMDF